MSGEPAPHDGDDGGIWQADRMLIRLVASAIRFEKTGANVITKRDRDYADRVLWVLHAGGYIVIRDTPAALVARAAVLLSTAEQTTTTGQ